MATKEPSFWDSIGPGLIQTGGNIFLDRAAAKRKEDLLRRAQGPLYDQQQAQAGQALTAAGNLDPNAMAAQRFKQQQELVAPGNEAEKLALFRQLQAKGMLDSASFAPVAGTASTPGVAMNPQMAALFAAQAGAKNQAAYQSMGEGQQYLNDTLQRAGMLQNQANSNRASGINAMTAAQINKPTLTEQLLKGGMNILKDPRARDTLMSSIKNIPDLLKGGASAVSGMFGSGGTGWLGGGGNSGNSSNLMDSWGF